MTRSAPVTRTVAIIKNHALQHRFDIEPRIQEASFEVCLTHLSCHLVRCLAASVSDREGTASGV